MLTRISQLTLIWGGAALLAFVAATSSIGAMAKQMSPSLALGLAPANGWPLAAIADRATRSNSAAMDMRSRRRTAPELVEIARRAYDSEPALAASLRTLALEAQAQGGTARAARMMQIAEQITKRDFLVNYWLIDAHSRAGRVDEAMGIYDQTLRALGERNGPILTMMAAALANPQLIGPLDRLLSRRPPWASAFWHIAAQVPSSLQNAATLRILQARRRIEGARDKDAMLFSALAQARQFDSGRRLYRVIGQRTPNSGQALVNNGDFSAQTDFPPFNWQLSSTGEMGAAIDPGAGMLEISVLGGSRGEVARQLVRLDSRRYAVQSLWRAGTSENIGTLRIELACAEAGGGTETRILPLPPGRSVRPLDLSGEACRNYWLVLAAEAPAGSAGFDAQVDRIQLVGR